MRISDILELATDYLWLGIIVTVILGSGYLGWYYLYFKKKWSDKRLNKKKVLGWSVFFIYLVVVLGATMLSRPGFFGNTRIYPLFYSYKDAWTDFSITEWRNIILNICMFVPLGFMLPQLVKKVAVFWKVSLVGFLFTLCIELLQLLLKRGIFEPDDLLGNTGGTMIGYGIYCVAVYVVHKRKKVGVPKLWKVVLCQIPLLMAIVAFSAIFIVYHTKELGNIPNTYILKQKNIEVTGKIEFLKETEKAIVYKTVVITPEKTMEIAEDIFGKLGCKIDETRTDIYENTALYYSLGDGQANNQYSIWVEYDGGLFRLTNYDKSFGSDVCTKENATEKEVRNALEQIGVKMPEGVIFEKEQDGEYTFRANKVQEGNKMYDGYISCTYFEDGTLGNINCRLLTLDEYDTVEIISEAKAYEQIVEGKFSYYRASDDVLKIVITNVTLGYELDTKGFYQPVYIFDGTVNEFETQIIIPAIE